MKTRAALVLLALTAAVVPISPAIVERRYSTSAYPVLQTYLTAVSNRVPFALFDVLLVVVIGGWVLITIADLCRYHWLRALVSIGARSIVLIAAVYLAFLVLWGFNYRRVPLAEKVQFDPAEISASAARALARAAVERTNALYEPAHRSFLVDPFDPRLADAFVRVQRGLGVRRPALPGRPKPTLLDFYFRRAAVDGMTDPYFLEALVTRDLLPFERPLVIAHEWSHLAGYADEGEANFIGWLTCLHSSESDQYSGWLFLYGELLSAVSPADRTQLLKELEPGPRSDRRAVADRVLRLFNPRVFAVGWTVYDRYLKANRVEAGTASYAEVVRLALGTRFGPDWTPLRR